MDRADISEFVYLTVVVNRVIKTTTLTNSISLLQLEREREACTHTHKEQTPHRHTKTKITHQSVLHTIP